MFSHRTCWKFEPNALTRALAAHGQAGKPWLDLTISNPTHAGLSYDAEPVLAALAQEEALTYSPEPKGMLRARSAVVDYYYRQPMTGNSPLASQRSQFDNSLSVRHSQLPVANSQLSAEAIVLTASTSEGYSFVFRLLCDAGDEVLVPVPSYPLFEFLATLHDVRLVPYSLLYDHGWHMDLHALEGALTSRTRALILVHPNNPTGSYVSAKEAQQLNAICAGREIALIVDEVFLDYSLAGPRDSFAFNQDALTFTLSGLSKISALPQMKFAWIAASGPPDLTGNALHRLEIIADTFLSVSTPVQLAAPVLLEQRHSIREQLVQRIHANLADLDRMLALQPGCTRLQVDGGWYAVLRIPALRSDEELVIALLDKKNVLVQPGYFYDFPGDGYLVLSLITPEERFSEGAQRLLDFCCA